MTKSIWGGLAIGAVIGGGLGDDAPSGDSNGIGGAKNTNNDNDSQNGGQGLFSLWGHEVWLYVGGILGFGDTAGVYLTTGPMIGKNPDWAIGGGIHFAKAFGLGVVIPIRQALQSYNKHQDKIGMYIDSGKQYLSDVAYGLNNAIAHVSTLTGGLEQSLHNFI